ncbi:hypothetical protein BDN71DRAFT_1162908 [Pleurotus eryngii]|uniref:TERF2-interacting telomeric protein 1 Myb domain-containing protein n=1 Tax=Pleurotus eryngii TaxID=5323 RepID=A0A9P5ZR30_PLEER|nr:hypothetical protein BDN71DRAFT_1162908 [Pleurotus eryngii]
MNQRRKCQWAAARRASSKFTSTFRTCIRDIRLMLYHSRTPFSQADKNNLAFYLSRKIPDKAAGGRYGNKVYEELSDNPHEEMQWAQRHTWQSWRQHYVKNDTDIDSRISEFVISHPPLHATEYNSDRRVTRMARRTSTEKKLRGRLT